MFMSVNYISLHLLTVHPCVMILCIGVDLETVAVLWSCTIIAYCIAEPI